MPESAVLQVPRSGGSAAQLRRCLRRCLLAAALPAAVLPAAATAQAAPVFHDGVFVNSELERYLRALQAVGRVPLLPWSDRGFSPAERDSLLAVHGPHPWQDRPEFRARAAAGLQATLLAPRTELIYNSAFPWGYNDGAVWAGRGLTAVVHAGAEVRYGPVSVTVAPVAFRAENRAFELAPTGEPDAPFADPASPRRIDLPQRFGDGAYERIDPGQSTLRLDVLGVAAGVSTANLHWGPAAQQPLLLGSNAPGFAHAFLGTSTPAGIGVGRLHGRVLWGRLEPSAWAPSPQSSLDRFGTGLVAVFQPRGLEQVELGLARFFHMPWDERGALKVFEAFFKRTFADEENPSGIDEANQLASVFIRWVLPAAGLELYGEYGREDHNWNFRDAVLEPDHTSAYTLGFAYAHGSAHRMLVVRGEAANSEPSHLRSVRAQIPWYQHGRVNQGHTHRGQVLGGYAVRGGRGASIAADLYVPGGRWTAGWARVQRRPGEEGLQPDVVHALELEALRDAGPFQLTGGITLARNFNRDGAGDASNIRLRLGVRAAH